ncbi:MAG: ferritin-like domain-containing protein [Thermoleophilaceae bacterium]
MKNSSTREPGDGQHAALDRLAREDGDSRAQFLKMAGVGAAGALAIFVAACGGDDEPSGGGEPSGGEPSGRDKTSGSKGSQGDIDIVNYALTLEFLEADFYQQVIDSGEVTGPAAEIAKFIGQNEQEHVQALTATVEDLGGTPVKAPQTNFEAVLAGGQKKILATAASVENLGAAAYLGQAGNIENMDILAAALSIHTIEARHAAVLNQVTGKTIVPDGAFAKPATMEQVLKMVKPFIKA